MPELLVAIAAFGVGLLGLIWSANIFVGGSAATAQHLGMSRAMIGLTIVALGTSAPEMIVSAGAALDGEPGLGIGNAVGSNIANIGLVLGVTALLGIIPVSRGVLRLELPLLLLATLAAIAVVWDGQLLRLESVFLLAATALLPIVLLIQVRSGGDDLAHALEDDVPDFSRGKALLWLAGGLIALLVSADVLVWGATQTATALGVSPMVIGLTVVALGTSLPELAASVASALKGHYEMALGNVIGSNILNILAVMSLPGIIAPGPISAALLQRDMVTMTLMTVVVALLMWRLVGDAQAGGSRGIGKKSGLLFLACYIAYYAVIALQLSGN